MAGSLPDEPIDDGETRLFVFVFLVLRACREVACGTLSGFPSEDQSRIDGRCREITEAEF